MPALDGSNVRYVWIGQRCFDTAYGFWPEWRTCLIQIHVFCEHGINHAVETATDAQGRREIIRSWIGNGMRTIECAEDIARKWAYPNE